jgi:hypothetical protein
MLRRNVDDRDETIVVEILASNFATTTDCAKNVVKRVAGTFESVPYTVEMEMLAWMKP